MNVKNKTNRKIAAAMALMISAGTFSVLPCTPFDTSVYAVSAPAAAPQSAKTVSASSDSQSGTSSDSSGMQKALSLAKSKITIPAAYSEFSYSTSEKNSLAAYYFKWSKKDKPYDCYEVTVRGGLITSYTSPKLNDYSYYARELSPFKGDELIAKAEEWIYRVNPSMKNSLTVTSRPVPSLYSSRVYASFARSEKDVRVQKNNISVTLDKMTGEVLYFNCSWWESASFPNASKALTREQIIDVYKKDVSLKPWYRIKYEKGKNIAQAVYVPQDSVVYDALTGKPSTMKDDYMKYLNTDVYMSEDPVPATEAVVEEAVVEAVMDGDGAALTPSELAALEEQGGLLTKEEFKKLMIADPYINVTDKFMVNSYDVRKNGSDYQVSAVLLINNDKDYCEYSIAADAKTGKVHYFSCRGGTESDEVINVSAANKLAESAAKYYCSDIWSKYKADTANTAPAVKTGKYSDCERTLNYYRYENNIQVSGDIISISVNSAGQVLSLSYNHTKNVDFGDGKILSPNDALNKLFEQKDFELSYDGFTDLQSKPHTYLHYTLGGWTVNAKTGKLSDYYGDAPQHAKEIPEECPYTDIGTSPYKDQITELYNHGIRAFEGDKLMAKKAVTKYELAAMLNSAGGNYISIPESEGNKTASRLDLAKLLVRTEGQEKSAGIQGIYKSKFTDIKDSDPNLGYIAIACGMKGMEGKSDGRFDPDGYVTREDAYHYLYNYIVNNPNRSENAVVEVPVVEEEVIFD